MMVPQQQQQRQPDVYEKKINVTFEVHVNFGNTHRAAAQDGFLTLAAAQAYVAKQAEDGDTAVYLIFKKLAEVTLINL